MPTNNQLKNITMKPIQWHTGLILWLTIGGLGQVALAAPEGGKGGGQRPPTEVAVIEVQPGTAQIVREYPGRLAAWRAAQVRARVEGIVEKRLFEEGTPVAADTPLYQIEDTIYRAALKAAEAEQTAARRNLSRTRDLVTKKLAAPETLDAAQARLQQAGAQLARARQDLENTRVPAPIAGRIGRSYVTEGALVGKGEATLLALIEQLDPLYVDFQPNEGESDALMTQFRDAAPTLPKQPRLQLLLAGDRAYPHPPQLLFGERRVDPATGTVLMRARLPNPQGELLPGTFVRVRMPVLELGRVLRVPQRAVQAGGKGLQVLTVDADGKVVPKAIVTGGMDGGDFLVVNGLELGDRVIVEGLQKVRPGATVKAVPWKGAGTQAAGH